jgi:hypothetical protein
MSRYLFENRKKLYIIYGKQWKKAHLSRVVQRRMQDESAFQPGTANESSGFAKTKQ